MFVGSFPQNTFILQDKLTCILEFLQSANAKYLILNSTSYMFVFNNYSVKTAMLQFSILN